jgi:methylmalonyl-CoA/ethylmalonyl-CoA epimerase
MNISHIEHIGIAVKELKSAINLYEKAFGLKCYAVEEVPDQKVRTAFFKVGETKIELLEATSVDSPIAKFIEKKGEGIHHIAFNVDSVQTAINFAESNDIKLIDKEPRKGAEGLEIAFLHPKSTLGVLTELCSTQK